MNTQLFFTAICCFSMYSYSQNNSMPKRIIENLSDGIIVTYEFPRPFMQPSYFDGGTVIPYFSGFGINDLPGEPAIPFRSDLFYIPEGINTRVDITETFYSDTTLILSPSIPSCLRNEILTSVGSITPYHGFFPINVVEYDELDSYRGVGLQRITIMPVQYNFEQHIVRSYSKIKYKISFLHNINNNAKQNQIINKTKDFLSKATLNYNPLSSTSRSDSYNELDVNNYLIITTNNYLDSLHNFIEWKRTKGNRIFLEARNRGEWTTDDIKDVIDSIHSLFPLDYVLMAGGFEDVPADSFTYYGGGKYLDCVTDYAYGLPTTNLQIAQISRGRIPVDNPQELSTILNKIIKYEHKPIMNDDFYKTALHCGEFSDYNSNRYEDACCIQTNENIREHLIHNNNFQIYQSYYFVDYKSTLSPLDTLYWNKTSYGDGFALPDSLQPSVFNWKANDVLSRINSGTLYVLYNGHGSKGGWLAPGFTHPKVDQLQNGEKQPVVFSLACLTGKYNEEGDCFAERMLKKEDGGCVGIFAATENSFPGYDDAMAYGMFEAVWPNLQLKYGFKRYGSELYPYTLADNPIYELGKVLDLGLLRMAETFGRTNQYDRREITEKLYHFLGDPSMMIYTEKPHEFIKPDIKYLNGKICVHSPCDSTKITFYTPSSTNPIIDSYIGDSIDYETSADSVIICLDKHNYVPYVLTFYKNIYIQNEMINDNRNYVGDNILIGNHVTTEKPIGNVIIENANVSIQGNSVKLHYGTRINHSRVMINK